VGWVTGSVGEGNSWRGRRRIEGVVMEGVVVELSGWLRREIRRIVLMLLGVLWCSIGIVGIC